MIKTDEEIKEMAWYIDEIKLGKVIDKRFELIIELCNQREQERIKELKNWLKERKWTNTLKKIKEIYKDG